VKASPLVLASVLFSVASPGYAEQHDGYTVSFDIRYHAQLGAGEFSKKYGEQLLGEATSLIAKKNDHGGCSPDWPACVNFVVSRVDTFTYQLADAVWPDDQTAEDWLLANPSLGNIKVFRTVKISNDFAGGYGPPGFFNAMVALWSDTDPNWRVGLVGATWAHEIGHNCSLGHNDSCKYNIMKDYLGNLPRDRLDLNEAESIETWSALYGSFGTVDCDGPSAAWLQGVEAVAGTGGVGLGFSTVWEMYTSSFEIRRVDPSSGATLYTLGEPPPVLGASGIVIRLSIPAAAREASTTSWSIRRAGGGI
jgi:hypothetical protein